MNSAAGFGHDDFAKKRLERLLVADEKLHAPAQ
jgi:hypothetical protein